MTTRYQEKHYEDMIAILSGYTTDGPSNEERHGSRTARRIARDFADLFAADNPRYCGHCGQLEGVTEICHAPDEEHIWDGIGFDRDKFLATCGLKESA